MKKVFIYTLAITAMMVACQPKDGQQNANSSKTTLQERLATTELETRVQDIYNDVFKQYMELNQQEAGKQQVNNDSVYCSADWNRCIARVDSVNQLNGTIDILDADHWIMGQDWGELSVSDVQVTSMTDSTATVELNLHNLGNVIPVRLGMIVENNAWRIDNFIDVKNDYDWKARMQEYLSQEKAK